MMMRSKVNTRSVTAAGGSSSVPSSYPELERSYLLRYGSDTIRTLHDRHAEKGIVHYCLTSKRSEVNRVIRREKNLDCSNTPGLTPGRASILIDQLRDNLTLFKQPSHQSLRWYDKYWKAIELTRQDLVNQVLFRNHGKLLQPVSFNEVARSESFTRNANKHAGFDAFVTGKRAKGDNIEWATEWCESHLEEVIQRGNYGIPLSMAHRSSNSKIDDWDQGTFKSRCRVVLMASTRQQLFDGRFLLPFNDNCLSIDWSEGGMTHEEVQHWINKARLNYKYYYSSDYSKFDTSQSDWLLEDVFYHIIKPCFKLSCVDDQLFTVMVNSYIHKEIHGFDGVYRVHKGNISGSLWTYWINTILNEVVDRTCILAQGFDPRKMVSLKCGDDNIVFHNEARFDPLRHADIIHHFFGIKTTIGESDYGSSSTAPTFLSRTWCLDGAERPVYEVIWNLIYPERFRDYHKSGLPELQAVALLLYCAYLEQPKTMVKYFDVRAITRDAGVDHYQPDSAYRTLARAGTGFYTSWINFHLGSSA